MADKKKKLAINKYVWFSNEPNKYLVDTEYLEYLELTTARVIRNRVKEKRESQIGVVYKVKEHFLLLLNEERKFDREFIRYMKSIDVL